MMTCTPREVHIISYIKKARILQVSLRIKEGCAIVTTSLQMSRNVFQSECCIAQSSSLLPSKRTKLGQNECNLVIVHVTASRKRDLDLVKWNGTQRLNEITWLSPTIIRSFPYLLVTLPSFLKGPVSLNILPVLRLRHFYSSHGSDCAQLTGIALYYVIKGGVFTRLPLFEMLFP